MYIYTHKHTHEFPKWNIKQDVWWSWNADPHMSKYPTNSLHFQYDIPTTLELMFPWGGDWSFIYLLLFFLFFLSQLLPFEHHFNNYHQFYFNDVISQTLNCVSEQMLATKCDMASSFKSKLLVKICSMPPVVCQMSVSFFLLF